MGNDRVDRHEIFFESDRIVMEIYFLIKEIRFEYYLIHGNGISVIKFDMIQHFLSEQIASPVFGLALELLENEYPELLL